MSAGKGGPPSPGGVRRGFFREALSLLGKLAEPDDQDEDARPSFVPPAPEQDAPRAAPRRVKRPPGALAEPEFLAACTRCGECLGACPEGTLIAGRDGFPEARVESHPCVMCRDAPCVAACEPGALAAEPRFAFGTARVYARLCLNHGRPEGADEEPCERCVDWCPVPGALTLGAGTLPSVDAGRCTGCGACAAHCAAYPQAITIR